MWVNVNWKELESIEAIINELVWSDILREKRLPQNEINEDELSVNELLKVY